MTAAQAIRGRRKAKLDPRYAYKGKKDASASQRKQALKIAEEKARQARKGSKK